MTGLIPESTVEWILASEEPAARWIALTRLLGRPPGDPEVAATHRAVLDDPGTRDLIGRLYDWNHPGPLSGHESAAYLPNLLGLLADMGVGAGDDHRVDAAVESLTHHADEAGRLATPAVIGRISPEPVLSALLCDSHAIVEILVRFGRAEHPVVRHALERMGADLAETAQGMAWPCLSSNGFRGPGRKGDACPQVTAEALRVFGLLPPDRRPLAPADTQTIARAALRIWVNRGTEQPYMFGHGSRFKTVKWPSFWYHSLGVLDALSGFPEVWSPGSLGADAEDRRAVAELVACLTAYNLGPDGRVIPRSCYRGFEGFSFGQKKAPSPFATARVLATLRPFEGLAADAADVEVLSLGSSKGGSGTPRPPR